MGRIVQLTQRHFLVSKIDSVPVRWRMILSLASRALATGCIMMVMASQPAASAPVNINNTGANGSQGSGCCGGNDGTNGGPGNPVSINNGDLVSGQSNGGAGGPGQGTFGGDGGDGGMGGTVDITTFGSITATGNNSAAVFAQSSGGRGGKGGDSDAFASIGKGGHGGAGGQITINNTANITATGNAGSGIVATTVGGAGGNGGSCGTGCFGGGGGGTTGVGGTIDITSAGAISTAGPSKSYGVFAQSVGGSGGAGGSNNFLFLAGWAADSQSGGDGGNVSVNVTGGSITTKGSNSTAIYAQSIGGGGGAGGTGVGLFVGVGGGGTAGGKGGEVTVNNSAKLTVSGAQSSGIFAQSVGGAGGAGGTGGSLFASFGGDGGAGEIGRKVEVHNYGDITVRGNGDFFTIGTSTMSAGIFAQSVGGGGGDGGIGIATTLAFGGAGGAGNSGGDVIVENTAKIDALCGNTCVGGTAIFAQSVGGGGGNGGGAAGVISLGGKGGPGGGATDMGGNVTVNNSGALTTTAQFSQGIFAQSIGGGGGNGAFAEGIASIGGSGGAGGNGGKVTVNNNNAITTSGNDSAGIFAQSVGGGGGNGGGAVAAGLWASFAMGGKGGAGGNGGVVCVNTSNGVCGNGLAATPATIKTTGDRSTGILAQSIGGGGGNGGFAVSASVGLFANVSIGAGGSGNAGGFGGDVYVGHIGAISTTGQLSNGIDAESIGGGGGNGGFVVAAGASTGGAVSFSLGGNGGSGNYGGKVIVDTHTSVDTTGDQSIGIFARSIGGGGGNGGFTVAAAGSPYGSLAISLAGDGGGGGAAGEVRVDNVGTIHTRGALSNGITAQSVGGGGGNGGFSVAGTVTIGTGVGASLSFGGGGGGGGTGNIVHVANNGDIITEGLGSAGIMAQSVGGGGGNGGFSGAIALSAGAALSNSVGGGGGNGNTAGAVDVTSTGSIKTMQDNAAGIIAQSIGGGGGNGAFSLGLAATLDFSAIGKTKGGEAGTGGTGNNVTVVSNGTIETHGALAYGIIAQSVGGGGGNGGFAIGAALSESGSASGNSVGGRGGAGNNAGDVMVTTNPTLTSSIPGTVISTTGLGATGIIAQSIGGGGGNGGFAINLNASLNGSAGSNSLGGDKLIGPNGANAGVAGDASDGHTVTVNNNGTIKTTGIAAHGIEAQSIGGGGGAGGFAISGAFSNTTDASSNAIGGAGGTGGAGGLVKVFNKGDINIGGDTANGIIAQSIGGGGGAGGFAIAGTLSLGGKAASNSLGGKGGNGGKSSEVDVQNSNAITIGGSHSAGIIAQSIGGGGGSGGFSIGAGVAINGSDAASDTVGGSGGGGGGGGIVRVDTFAGSSITTKGVMDYGIQAQSIGGGGGSGGFSISGTFSTDGDAKSTVGGDKAGPAATGAGGGDGALVAVSNGGLIDTQGFNSVGIMAQSIGGGGGSGGFSISAGVSIDGAAASTSVGGMGGDGGKGGQVMVTNEKTGVIHTEMANSTGIVAQSIGGGGGSGGFAIAGTFSNSKKATTNTIGGAGGKGGMGGQVDVTNKNMIQVDGARSTGILAQSIGGGGGSGGFAIGAGVTASDAKGASDAVGGSGGTGGNGGQVTVTTTAGSSIVTKGAMSNGIVAQAIGGGGGAGGFSISGAFSLNGDASASVGGSQGPVANGAGGGNGGIVVVDNAGLIDAQGINSIGVLAQSIGGGGGTGGFTAAAGVSIGAAAASNSIGGTGGDGGRGGKVTVTNQVTGVIHTEKANSIGISAQSIGGGGGTGGFAIGGTFSDGSSAATNSVGGKGGKGGDGGTVDVTNKNIVQVDAAHSIGILAQSIGGGGGTGGFAIGGGVTVGNAAGATDTIGGSGGNGGKADTVTVTTTGGSFVVTSGLMDSGIVAQSIGGGGGTGGFTLSGSFASSGDAKSNVGGSCDMKCQTATGGAVAPGGGGGAGGMVVVDNSGSVITDGASSVGIIAQSIGGGGGTGGFAGAFSISTGGGSASSAIGGSGGNGGRGNEVDVYNRATGFIHTLQANSVGIIAQSIGGGGGNGGFALNASGSTGDSMGTAVGGSGGHGGAGGTVRVENNGIIVTEGALSTGIIAQSIGGGGGNGAFSVAGTVSSGSGGVTSSVGGTGGDGGAGGDVTVINTGLIQVKQAGSVGIVAQSIGGGGGNGGFSGALDTSGSLKNNVGGTGGKGGAGGNVTVKSTGSIVTAGSNSVAVIAQSIGGGGGAGGFAISVATGNAPSADINVGGVGLNFPVDGTAGAMGTVTVDISGGQLHTTGKLAPGALVQSIAGGGGIAGLVVADPLVLGPAGSTLQVGAVNGLPGSAMTALTPTNSNLIVTDLAGSFGWATQSIGGGGGVGQVAGEYDLANAALAALVGGSGVNGGSGNVSAPTNSGNLMTSGDNSIGLIAQSIGGGGGLATFSLQSPTGSASSILLQTGGSQGTLGSGLATTLTTGGIMVTKGNVSPGAVAQSIGGGGGIAGFSADTGITVGAWGLRIAMGSSGGAGGIGGVATGNITSGQIHTMGYVSPGFVTQSIGGGGGFAGFYNGGAVPVALKGVTLGATGGAGGSGGAASVVKTADIYTDKAGSVGVIAQSIGGGGGTAVAYGVTGTGPVTLGASNGASGNAGAVDVASSGIVVTTGAGAHGIVAQSIGGGGGFFQAFDSAGAMVTTNVQAAIGGGGGSGANVSVTNTGDIQTTGAGAHGIVAQSIGGGGGIVGGGIFANSLSTSGPFAGSAGGTGSAGQVKVDNQANIYAMGKDSIAIFAQSANASGLGGPITIDIAAGKTVAGGSGAGNAVRMIGGATNTLTNNGAVTTVAGVDGMTVFGGLGADRFINFGFANGSVDLGSGANFVDNKTGAFFDSGATVNVGAGNLVLNEGLISPGSLLRAMTTNITGNFEQSPTVPSPFNPANPPSGVYAVDIDYEKQIADRINVTGTAKVSGTVVVNVNEAGDARPGTHDSIIVHTGAGETHPNLALSAEQTAVSSYSLAYPNGFDIVLRNSVDFSPAGLTRNQHAVGNAVNFIQYTQITPTFKPIAAALFFQPTVAQLGVVYDSLSGEGVAGIQQGTFIANEMFMSTVSRQMGFWVNDNEGSDPRSRTLYGDRVMSYAPSTRAQSSAFGALAQVAPAVVAPRTWRAWSTGFAGYARAPGETSFGSASTSISNAGFAAGLDYQLTPNALVGVATGYGAFSFGAAARETTGTADGGHVAIYGALREQNLYATGTLAFDFFAGNETRHASIPGIQRPALFGTLPPNVPGINERPRGQFQDRSVSGKFEVGYRAKLGGFDLTPFAGMQFSSLRIDGFKEGYVGDASLLGLAFAGRSVLSLPTFLGIEVSSKMDVGDGKTLNAWLRSTWKHEFETRRAVQSSFLAAPGFNFIVEGARAPRDLARVNAGMRLEIDKNFAIFASVDGDFAPRSLSYGASGGVRVSW